VADASLFPDPTDKTTTLSIIAFSLRTSEYLLDNFGKRVHRRA
jgi:choline dehydrogenase-like flavoprotein